MSEHDWVVDDIVQFLRSPLWVHPLQQFVDVNCILFSTSGEGECTLEHTNIHKKFQTLVESLLEEHLTELGVSNEDFFQICLEKEELKDIGLRYPFFLYCKSPKN